MHRLTQVSWRTAGLLAAAWILVWVTAAAVVVGRSLGAVGLGSGSGGVAALGFGISTGAALIIFGPPFVLLALRLLVGRMR